MIVIANQFIKIYNSMVNISKINFSIQQSYQIYLLNQEFKKHYDFLLTKEKQLFDQCGAEIDENGKIKFNSDEDAQNFEQKYNELYTLELNFSIEKPIEININSLDKGIKISPQDIENLNQFILFKEENDNGGK